MAVGYDRTPPGEHALSVAAGEADRRGGSLAVITAHDALTAAHPRGGMAPADTEAAARKAAEETAEYGAGLVRAFDEAARRDVGLTVVYVWDEPWMVSWWSCHGLEPGRKSGRKALFSQADVG